MERIETKQIAIVLFISIMLLFCGTLITLFLNNYLISNYNDDEISTKATFVYREN